MMKKMFLFMAVALTSFAFAQNVASSAVPSAVASKFSTLYPNSKAEQWKNVKGNYETKFTQDKTKMCVVIDPSGNVVKTTTTIAVSELPKSVSGYVTKNYPKEKIRYSHQSVPVILTKCTTQSGANLNPVQSLF